MWGLDRDTVQLVNNSFRGDGYAYAAISTVGSNLLLEGNVCDINGNNQGTQGHCYYIEHGHDIVLRDNVARGMTGYGIHIFDQRRSEDAPSFQRRISNVLVEGNTLYQSEQRAGLIVAASDEAKIANVVIRNNLSYENGGLGMVIRGDSSNIQVYNNTIFGNGDAPLGIYDPQLTNVEVRNNILGKGTERSDWHIDTSPIDLSTVHVNNNLYWPGPAQLKNLDDSAAIVADPQFVNPVDADYRLQAGSAALDSGLAIDGLTQDKLKQSRPWGLGVDLGAYERTLPKLPGDANGDSRVDIADFIVLRNNFGKSGSWSDGDFDENGLVDIGDFVRLRSGFGAAAPVPEPTHLALLTVLTAAACGYLIRRCR